MSDFIDSRFRKLNLPPQNFPKKIKILKGDLSLEFLLASDLGKDYKIVFIVNLIPIAARKDPSILLTPATVDMVSLRDTIIANLKEYDRQYVTLNKFDTRKAEFYFNYSKWLKDAAGNLNPYQSYSKFQRTFRFQKRLPFMILSDPLRRQFEKFLIRKFLDFMEETKKDSKWFNRIVPMQRFTRMSVLKVRNMFEWDYDITKNVLIATLKPIYIFALLYAIGKITKRDTERLAYINIGKEKYFSDQVEKNLRSFNINKYKEFIRIRNLI